MKVLKCQTDGLVLEVEKFGMKEIIFTQSWNNELTDGRGKKASKTINSPSGNAAIQNSG